MMAPAPKKLRALELGRVSTNKQDLERQQYDLEDNREEFGLEPIKTFWIKESGEKVLSSEEWAEVEAELKAIRPDVLSVSAVDRMARPQNMADFARFQVFIDLKIAIASKREKLIEPWTPRGRKTLTQALFQAGNELSDLKDRLVSNRRKMHKNNTPANTDVPYGILYRDKYSKDAAGKCQYFYEDPAPASNGRPRREIVNMIFEWRYIERLKIYRIVKRLNGLGILTGGKRKKDGSWQYEPGLWSTDTVRQLLRNRHYIGEHWEGGKKVDVTCPQFIDHEVFEAVQASFLVEKDKADKKGRDSNEALLHEYITCDLCKKPMYINRRPHYYVYRCFHMDRKLLKRACTMRQVRAHIIEPVVFLALWKHLTDHQLLLANARAYIGSLPSRPEAAVLEKELKEVEARIGRMQRMVHKGTYDEDKGNAEILADQRRIAEIKAELTTAGVMDLPEAHLIESACRRIAEGRMPAKFDTQRPVLEKLIGLKVYWDGQDAVIEGKVPVPAAAQQGRKCGGGVHGAPTSTLFIPFKIKERVPEAPPRGSRKQSLKGWETRRAKQRRVA